MKTLSITLPDDWHLHIRDAELMQAVLPFSAAQFGRALIMPNLKPPVIEVAQALAYQQRIQAVLPPGNPFRPLMTLYLTEATSEKTIKQAAEHPDILACKLYPAGATTHSEHGVNEISRIYPLLETMQQHDLPLLIHGEVVDPTVDIYDREACFIDRHLQPIAERFPGLRIVLEHITTREGVEFIAQGRTGLAGTLTAHHLLYNRNDMLAGGVRPHFYCLPILKRDNHRQALLKAATSGNPRFFLGTDSAPHSQATKEAACGCAGCFTAHAAIELYATAFEQAGALEQLEGFASHFGADFYRLPRNASRITLIKQSWQSPEQLTYAPDSPLIPLLSGQTIDWKILRNSE